MSDAQPDRTLPKLPERPGASARNLIKSNRSTTPPADAPVYSPPEWSMPPAQPQIMQPPAAPAVPEVPARAKPMRITFDIPSDLRNRVRAMYKATRDQEGDDSFAGMLCTMIERECQRRESIYNQGEKFVGGERQLPKGRPLI